jgi:hypothetical protein
MNEKRGFREWKTLTMTALLSLIQKHPEKRSTIEALAAKLQYIKVRELAQFIFQLHLLSYDVPEVSELIPDPETVRKWIETGGNDE